MSNSIFNALNEKQTKLEDAKEISEDEKKREEKVVDQLVKEMNTTIDVLILRKNTEIMKI